MPKIAREPIRAPLQARSRDSMDRIMKAVESLLAEKPFDRITMQELAERSGTSTGSIYARFSDKRALVFGAYEHVRAEAMQCLEELTDPHRWRGKPIEDVVQTSVLTAIRFYNRHHTLLRAALFLDEDAVREQHAASVRAAAEKFDALYFDRFPVSAKASSAVDAAVSFFVSVMQSRVMFGTVEFVRTPISERKLARQLSKAVLALLQDAG